MALIGDLAWQVDWYAGIPFDEYGNADIDNADDRTETYRHQVRAEVRAQEVTAIAVSGVATVTPVEFTAYDDDDAIRYPHVGYWETIGESKEFNK